MAPLSHACLVAALALLANGKGVPPLEVVPWLGYDPAAPLDRGRGVVAFPDELSTQAVDSIAILASPAKGAAVQAWFFQRHQEDTSPFGLAVPAGLTLNLVEFDYEVMGLAVDSIGAKAAWARVVYGFDAKRQPRFGWVALDPAATRLIRWADFLPLRDLFLVDSVPWRFLNEPLGSAVAVPTPPSARGYALHPVTSRGAWLQVRIVIPSDVCVDPNPEARTTVGWLEYLDAAGRPRVWFSPRGC